MKKVAVGSKNPVKINAVKLAFGKVWPDEKFEFIGIDVDSGVASQPMSTAESIKGARNRAIRSQEKLKTDFGVGLEGGLHEIEGEWFDAGWMVVVDRDLNEGIGSTIHLHTPKKAMELIHSGKELGEVTDILFGQNNSKQGNGQFGNMTNNNITRTSGYIDGVIAALARFLQPHLYED